MLTLFPYKQIYFWIVFPIILSNSKVHSPYPYIERIRFTTHKPPRAVYKIGLDALSFVISLCLSFSACIPISKPLEKIHLIRFTCWHVAALLEILNACKAKHCSLVQKNNNTDCHWRSWLIGNHSKALVCYQWVIGFTIATLMRIKPTGKHHAFFFKFKVP